MSKAIEDMTDAEFESYMNSSIAKGEEVVVDEEVEVDTEDTVEVDTVDEVEKVEEATEQPTGDADAEDSDDNDTDEDDKDETEEGSEEEVAADEESDEKPTEGSTEKSEEPVEVPKYKVRAGKMDFEFTPEELVALAPKALDYTKKMQQIAPYRKMISAIEDAKLGKDDINQLIDVLKGDKAATTALIKRTGVDVLELDMDAENVYTPRDYGRNEKELAIGDILEDIMRDPEYTTTEYVVDSQWDKASRTRMMENPDLITELHKDVKSGVFDKVSPMAFKMKALDGGKRSDIEYYIAAGAEYYKAQQQSEIAAKQAAEKVREQEKAVAEAKAREEKQKLIKKTANKRKAAAVTKTGGSKDNRSVMDYLSDDSLSDEEFSKLMEKQIRKG